MRGKQPRCDFDLDISRSHAEISSNSIQKRCKDIKHLFVSYSTCLAHSTQARRKIRFTSDKARGVPVSRPDANTGSVTGRIRSFLGTINIWRCHSLAILALIKNGNAGLSDGTCHRFQTFVETKFPVNLLARIRRSVLSPQARLYLHRQIMAAALQNSLI
jgi:hypothetical protein